MAAKRNKEGSLLVWAGVAVALYFLLKKKAGGQSAGSAAGAAAGNARALVADAVNRVTFVPDTTTDKQLYQQDQNACR